MMDSIEALADAIMQFEGWKKDSRAWRNRNPGNLRPYSKDQKADDEGYRIFTSLADGFSALRMDLTAKFNGSKNLTPDSTILDLLNIYAPAGDANNPSQYAQFVCGWTSHILGRVITPSTSLKSYLGN